LRFVAEQRHVYGVKRLCRVLGVSRSGFYAWLGRSPSARSVSDAELAGMIVEIHDRSRRTYGAPWVHAELARVGRRCGRKRVARLMRSQQLVGVHARRRWRRGETGIDDAQCVYTGDLYDGAGVAGIVARRVELQPLSGHAMDGGGTHPQRAAPRVDGDQRRDRVIHTNTGH
jgi:hypothetical protein